MCLEYDCQVSEHQFARDRQDDDAEEFPDDIERHITQILGQPVGTYQDEVEGNDTKRKGDTEAGDTILGGNSQQGSKRARARIHRESERNDRTRGSGLALQLVVLEDHDVQDHLQRHEEDNKSTRDSEILYSDAEELEDPFAEEEESQQDKETDHANLQGIDLSATLLHSNRNRNITERIDDSNQENERGQDLPNVHLTKEILYCFHNFCTIWSAKLQNFLHICKFFSTFAAIFG